MTTAPLLEVIATSIEDGIAAAQGGADRLEVVRDMAADGLTPSLDLVQRLRDAVALPLRVMLRPANTFAIGEDALDALCDQAEALQRAGIDEVVLGYLDAYGALDLAAVREVLNAARPKGWTLHRAFDHALDARTAFDAGVALPRLDSILSAGSRLGLDEGLPALCKRATWQTQHVRWLAGGGLRPEHVPALLAAGIRQFHSGRAVRHGGRWDAPVDVERVRRLCQALSQAPDAPGACGAWER